MAAATMPAPGTELGPCAEPCQHTDCAESRRIAETRCAYCGRPIGYDTRFYSKNDSIPEAVTDYVHAVCEERAFDID